MGILRGVHGDTVAVDYSAIYGDTHQCDNGFLPIGETCCRNCCYSTPLVTLGAVFLTAFGLLGFTVSSIYGLAMLDTVPHLENG